MLKAYVGLFKKTMTVKEKISKDDRCEPTEESAHLQEISTLGF